MMLGHIVFVWEVWRLRFHKVMNKARVALLTKGHGNVIALITPSTRVEQKSYNKLSQN